MNCDSISNLIPLYYYGELTPEQEDAVEEHTHQCRACAHEVEQQRSLAAALDQRQMETPPLLLDDCRADLLATLHGGVTRAAMPPPSSSKGPWALFLDAMAQSLSGLGRLRQPIGAAAMLAIGFYGARLTTVRATAPPPVSAADVFTTVRSVQPDQAGHVQIAYDETRRNMVRGRVDDPDIQRLMLAGAHEDNAAVRVEAVDLLRTRAGSGSTEVRDALLNAVAADSNPAVRLKALAGLKPLAGDAEVRKALSRVLLSDNNAAVRMQVVDILVAHRDDYMVGLLQGMVQHENNDSVRLKLEKALKDMNASVGTF
ncbi:MAG TPA: HEAT repeat domain-containing protein [Candidatus Acidoferrum sp.]|nr:HEAT repeat domain-containing protein [Candidatus Acidoferrum sp.]